MISVIVNGAKGAMGLASIAAVNNDPELELVGQTDLGDDLGKTIKETGADVVVDFTQPDVRMQTVTDILSSGAHAVVGTTGFNEADLKIIEELCKNNSKGCLIAPNFAIGAVLMMEFAAKAAEYMPDVEIVEYHHDHKKDAPSGTAIKTAQLINDTVGKTNPPAVKSEELLEGIAQGAEVGNIRIHSVRLPGFIASQEVIMGALGQTLKLRHDSINRECFMPGVVMGCKRIVSKTELLYGLEKLM